QAVHPDPEADGRPEHRGQAARRRPRGGQAVDRHPGDPPGPDIPRRGRQHPGPQPDGDRQHPRRLPRHARGRPAGARFLPTPAPPAPPPRPPLVRGWPLPSAPPPPAAVPENRVPPKTPGGPPAFPPGVLVALADPPPPPPLPSTADPTPYAPVSWLAVAAMLFA